MVQKRCRVLFDAPPDIVHYRVSRMIEVRTGKAWLCEMRDSEIDPAASERFELLSNVDDVYFRRRVGSALSLVSVIQMF